MPPLKAAALVALGGAVGTMARHGVAELIDTTGSFPASTFTVNVLGSFALGALLGWLITRERGGPTPSGHTTARLLLGTGLLGGFTTYSALAIETDALLRADDIAMAAMYAGGTVIVGFAAAVAGIRASRVFVQ